MNTIQWDKIDDWTYEQARRLFGVPPGIEAPISIVDILIGRMHGDAGPIESD